MENYNLFKNFGAKWEAKKKCNEKKIINQFNCNGQISHWFFSVIASEVFLLCNERSWTVLIVCTWWQGYEKTVKYWQNIGTINKIMNTFPWMWVMVYSGILVVMWPRSFTGGRVAGNITYLWGQNQMVYILLLGYIQIIWGLGFWFSKAFLKSIFFSNCLIFFNWNMLIKQSRR